MRCTNLRECLSLVEQVQQLCDDLRPNTDPVQRAGSNSCVSACMPPIDLLALPRIRLGVVETPGESRAVGPRIACNGQAPAWLTLHPAALLPCRFHRRGSTQLRGGTHRSGCDLPRPDRAACRPYEPHRPTILLLHVLVLLLGAAQRSCRVLRCARQGRHPTGQLANRNAVNSDPENLHHIKFVYFPSTCSL